MKLWRVEIAKKDSFLNFGRYRGCAKDAATAGAKSLKRAKKFADKDDARDLYVESIKCLGDKDF